MREFSIPKTSPGSPSPSSRCRWEETPHGHPDLQLLGEECHDPIHTVQQAMNKAKDTWIYYYKNPSMAYKLPPLRACRMFRSHIVAENECRWYAVYDPGPTIVNAEHATSYLGSKLVVFGDCDHLGTFLKE